MTQGPIGAGFLCCVPGVSRSPVRPIRAAGAAALVAAIAVVAVAVVVINGRETPAAVKAQKAAGAQLSALAARIAAPWVRRRAESGLFVDPISGGAGHGYGPAMLAEALIRDGARRGDRRMLRAGLKALSVNAGRAADDGNPGNPLELLAIASAYRWAEGNLADDPDWRKTRAGPRRYLREWEFSEVGRAAQGCFVDPSCWNNYKIVDATGVLLLLDTKLEPATSRARLAHPEQARAAAVAVLERALPLAIGRGAEARTPSGTLTGLGLLADQPTYPLAYHALSVAALARALDVLGDDAPPAAVENFRRAMVAEASYMAPDGDVAFLGRAQGESWALGATAYAGEACADRFNASNPRTAGMCATLAERAVKRLRLLHGFNEGLLAIVPRLSSGPLTNEGLEHYARVSTFNGLTAMFLEWASEEAKAAQGAQPAALPLDGGGAFVDPAQSRMAVVRRDDVWFAVHAIGPRRVADLRYDFGVISLKGRRADHWVDVVPPRPLGPDGVPFDGGGPALVTPSGLAYPQGTRLSFDDKTGEVVVRGGYRTLTGVWALQGVDFRFRPSARGVTATASAPPGSVLRYQDFLPADFTEIVGGGVELRTPTFASRLSETPALVEPGLDYASAYALGLRGYRRSVTVPASGNVRWTLTARTLPGS